MIEEWVQKYHKRAVIRRNTQLAKENEHSIVDLFIVGGGVNGCGVARDAAGRGLSVTLAEMGDLGAATSSASTKLFHGGLRYLEYFKFRLVRESLAEREILLRAMPHISWPMRFVLPYQKEMRFEENTPLSRLLVFFMPWLKGRRPAWLIRLGLFLYDQLGHRKLLLGTSSLDLRHSEEGTPLQIRFARAFEYSDCWVEDSRLVILNARDAQARGARILSYCKVISAMRDQGLWRIETEQVESQIRQTHYARLLVNAAGPWVSDIIHNKTNAQSLDGVRLVRGSHIVTRKLYDHDKAYFLQGLDGRVIFAIPYEGDFTLVGTTDVDHPDPWLTPTCTEAERSYLLTFANSYFRKTLTDSDIVWTYSGVRPLYDDGAKSASAATRDYVLKLDTLGGAPMLNIFGGKITTYRRLAEAALAKIADHFPQLGPVWTADAPLPGGDFSVTGFEDLLAKLQGDFPFLSPLLARRLLRAYGTQAYDLLQGAQDTQAMGQDFGFGLSAREVLWLMRHEFVRTADDILWRRSKLGLRLSQDQGIALSAFMLNNKSGISAAP